MAKDYDRNFNLLTPDNHGFWIGKVADRKNPVLALPIVNNEEIAGWEKVASFDSKEKFVKFVKELEYLYGEAEVEE